MPETPRPTIPAGDIVRRLRLPGWLRRVFDFFRGLRIHAGPVDVQLDQTPGGPTLPGTGLDQPHDITRPRGPIR